MVAVVGGSGLGLFGSSVNGNAVLGRGHEKVLVNTTTGNLILQNQDEALSALGLDLALTRTYNSQGLLNDDNGDNWRLGVQQQVYALTGTLNAANSTITKIFGDGREVVYRYDTAQGRYVSSDGDGAHDTLQNSSGTWTWTDGTGRNTETYDSNGRFTSSRDADGNTVSYAYTGSLLTQITDASGQITYLDYTGNNLTQIRVVSNSQTQTLTRYTYDSSNRLTQVRVDLTPADNSVADGAVYTTTYTYEGTSKRILSVTQSDGSSVNFTYELVNGVYRVKTYEEGAPSSGATANTAVLQNTETVTTTNNYSLNTSLTNAPGWSTPTIVGTPSGGLYRPRLAFNANGDALAVWNEGNATFNARFYRRATDSWSATFNLRSGGSDLNTDSTMVALDDAGNALFVYQRLDVPSGSSHHSIFAMSYSAATQTWSAEQTLGSGTNYGIGFPNTIRGYSISLKNGVGAVSWVTGADGSNVAGSLYVARFNNGSLVATQLVENATGVVNHPTVRVANNGDIMVVWTSEAATGNGLWVNRFRVSTGTWTGPAQLAVGASTITELEFDNAGNAYVVWRTGPSTTGPVASNVMFRKFNASTSVWETAQALYQQSNTYTAQYGPIDLVVDGAGNALVAFVDVLTGEMKTRQYDPATGVWAATKTVTGSGHWDERYYNETLIAMMNNGRYVLTWHDGPSGGWLTSTLTNGTWSAATQFVTGSTGTVEVRAALDDRGNMVAIWTAGRVTVSRYSVDRTYLLPANPTWASVAQALYGSSAAAAGLQSQMGNPPLVGGTVLLNPPMAFSVTTSTTYSVAPYYTVLAGDTWATITQAVYGTSAAGAVNALRAALDNVTLTTGLHLTMPLSLAYFGTGRRSTLTYDAPTGRTDVQDALGYVTSYFKDSQGRLSSVLSPTVGGVRLETRYAYDADGNLTSITEDPTGLNRITVMEYDGRGNMLLKRDSLGNTVTRTYDANNQLLTQTLYQVRDPDGAGSGQPSSPMTTRYAYDSESHLRYEISAEGRVTEHQYNPNGQLATTLQYVGALYTAVPFAESDLTTWANAQNKSSLERIDYAYDFRGNVTTATSWSTTTAAGVGSGTPSITRFVYDQRGQLLQTVDPRGEATPGDSADYLTSYTYDGLGRLQTTTQWIASGVARTSVTVYDDANRHITTTLANGLVTTQTFNLQGEIISVTNDLGATQASTTYAYDNDGRLVYVTDPTGVRQFFLYDEAGRKVAQVDGDGSLTELIYDRANELIKTVGYATRLSDATRASMASGTAVTLASLRTEAGTNPTADRISRNVYNAAGLLVYSIDEIGAVTEYRYDGAARITDTVRHRNLVTISRSVDQVLPGDVTIADHADDRRTRTFYDNDGLEIGNLDAEGALTEYGYDEAGRRTREIHYANTPAAGIRATGTFADLKTSAGLDNETATDPERDATTWFLYDGQGRQNGVLDAEGFLTETVFDAAGNVAEHIRYGAVLSYSAGATVDLLRGSIAATVIRERTIYTRNGAGQVTSETTSRGTATAGASSTNTYGYDAVGNQLNETRAAGTAEARGTEKRYDLMGRVLRELSAEGHAAITAGMTQAQIEDIWNRYAVTYVYDLGGRRISATSRPDDVQTNVTLYFYDNDGRVRFVVNPLGERIEYRYDAFGQLRNEIQYTTRIATAGLQGGLLTSALETTLTASADAQKDSLKTLGYTLTGHVNSEQIANTTTAAEDSLTTSTYNVFGEKDARIESLDATHTLRTDFIYDKRGRLTQTQWDNTAGGFNKTETRTYDAFGRLRTFTDARSTVLQRYEYDRLGRQITSVDANTTDRTITTYDAFGRTLTIQDALGNLTHYDYDDVNRRTKVTTPEGIEVTTTFTAHGQTLSVAGAGNTTTYEYDANGQIKTISDSLGTLESRTYDRGGRQVTDTNARGTLTRLAYDAAGRVLTRTVDDGPDGLHLATTYVYDGQGHLQDVTEPSGRLTRTTYDRSGRVTLVAVDPNGLNLRTRYAYDLDGKVITVTRGEGSANPQVTQYRYDTLGRRTHEILDPGTGTNPATGLAYLNITTEYRYDLNDNVTREIDARGNSTWYVYDAQNRLTDTIDALGGVTSLTYDAEDRVVSTRRHAAALAPSTMTALAANDRPTSADFSIGNTAADAVSRSFYDGDGNEKYVIDSLGVVTERQYDANGNVVRERVIGSTTLTGTYNNAGEVTTALGGAATTIGANDRVQWNAYDLRGRAAFSVDGLGAVTQTKYDAAGNEVAVTKFAASRSTTLPTDLASLQTWADANAGDAQNRTSRSWYDTLNRLRFATDAEGFITETRYDDAGRRQIQIVLVNKPAIPSSGTLIDLLVAVDFVRSTTADQTTTTLRDAAGRALRITDSVGNYKEYTYDATGNVLTYRNEKGSIWNYVYDANGKLKEEASPSVSVTIVSDSGSGLASNGSNARIVTQYGYDNLGNLTSRTEGIRRFADNSTSTVGSRLTTYSYDLLGRQTVTTFPAVDLYNGSYTDFSSSTSLQSVSLYSETTYDALGNATRNRDVAGTFSYKVYDAQGHVRYEIDALGYVTEHTYDSFGNELTTTRFAQALSSLPAFSDNRIQLSDMDSAVVALRSNAQNRTITKAYDRVDRVLSVSLPTTLAFEPGAGSAAGRTFSASPTTFYEYNAFGQVIREWQLIDTLDNAIVNPASNSTANSWSSTHYYYDRRGLKVAQVDALRYLTTYEYDETGDVTRQREYAVALTGFNATSNTQPAPPPASIPGGTPSDLGYDRETVYTYDQLNNLTTESLQNIEYGTFVGQVLETRVGARTKQYRYDAIGNRVYQLDGNSISYNYYDALGRLIAVADTSRNRGNDTSLVPLTEMRRDAYGNLVEQVGYGAGAATVSLTSYTLAATTPALERHNLLKLDSHGRAVKTQDAISAVRFAAYNARGDVVKEWQDVTNRDLSDLGSTPTTSVTETLVTINEYDVLGRRTVSHEAQSGGATPTIVHSRAQYNAFGEITQKSVDGGWAAEYYEYDNGGHLWKSNSGDGVDKVYLYDLAGHATAEIRSRTLDLANSAYTASAVSGLSGTMRTETRYDLLGRVLERRLPQFDIAGSQATIDAQPIVGMLNTPNPPNAVYRRVDVGGSVWGREFYVLQPSTWADGGGYYQVSPPSVANPYGTYARVSQASYTLTSARQFYWQAPTGIDVVATFEYWSQSNPSAVTSVTATSVSAGYIGVNINALSGDYGYRISYRRTGASSEYARQEGTFNTATGAVILGTSSALQTLTATPTTLQSLDRWGNVISVKSVDGGITQYRYNQFDQLTLTLLPNVNVLDTRSGVEQRTERSQLRNFYDLYGNRIESRDGNGATTRAFYNFAGQLIQQWNADDAAQGLYGSTRRFTYDAFGNQIQVIDELGYETRYVYDGADNLIQTAREIELNGFASTSPTDTSATTWSRVVWENYTYDQAGRRTSETNGEGETTKYWYDLRGNLIRRRTPRNFDTTYEYDAFNRKTRETDANLSYSTWTQDAFGRLTSHRELVNTGSQAFLFQAGGATNQYTYDEAGLLTLQTNDLGLRRELSYDAAGNLTSLVDNGVAVGGSGLVSSNRVSTYTYDASGRKARETVVVDGRTHQDTRIDYDAMGRISSLDDVDYRLNYSYDANGNRTLIQTTYRDHQQAQHSESSYYRYDAMNRVTISQGFKTTGAVPDLDINSTQGIKLTYNARGDRTSIRTAGTRFQIIDYLTNGVFSYRTVVQFTPTDGMGSEYYSYDGLGRLTVLAREADKLVRETTTGDTVGGSWSSEPVETREYDKASRLVTDTSYIVEGSVLVPRVTTNYYDDDGRSEVQTTSKNQQLESVVHYGDATANAGEWYRGYDAASVLRGYKVDVYQNGSYRYTTTYVNSYRLRDGYTETGQSASSTGTGAPQPGSTTRTYNVNNELVQFTDSIDATRTRYFANNAAGQALTVIQGQFDGASGRMTVGQAWDAAVNRTAWAGNFNQPKAQYFFFANDNYVGSFGQLQDASNAFKANFDVNYTPISSEYPGAVPEQVIAQAGDTLRTLAARVFGDASLWYLIAEANGLSDPDAALPEGAALKVPNDVVSLSNTATSFKPYDASKALGDTSPTQPAPPAPKHKKGCGVLGTVLIIVVAIVVTYFTAGLATTAIGGVLGTSATATAVATVAGGVIGAAAGSIVSQGVAIAIGMQESFSWKSVAAAAIAAGLAPGASALGSSLGSQIASAAINSAVNQGVNIALGLQKDFNWKAVAASAVAAPVASQIGGRVSTAVGGGFVGEVAGNFAVGLTNQVAYAAFAGGKIDYTQLAADAFGNALGNSINAKLSEPRLTAAAMFDSGEVESVSSTGELLQQAGAVAPASGSAPAQSEVSIRREVKLEIPETLDEIKINTSFSTSLGTDVDALINASPILQNQLDSLLDKGGHVYLDPGPTRADPDKNNVYLNVAVSGRSPENYVRSLAHELGHIAFGPGVTSVGDMTHSQFVTTYVNSLLASEGEATLNVMAVREQLLQAGKADINPLTGTSVKYQQIYEELKVTGDRAAAQSKIGEIFRVSEHPNDPSRPPTFENVDTYGVHYTKAAEENWTKFAAQRRSSIASNQASLRKNQQSLQKLQAGIADAEAQIKRYKDTTFVSPESIERAEQNLAQSKVREREFQAVIREQQQKISKWRKQLDSP